MMPAINGAMQWALLMIGCVIEILATASLKLSDGFTRPFYAVLAVPSFGLASDEQAILGIGFVDGGGVVLNTLSMSARG